MVSPLPTALPELPEARAASESVRAWAESDAGLAAMLASGMGEARAALRWGTELLRGGRASDAVTVLRAAAALEPELAAVWTSLGVALARTGDDAKSVACLARSVEIERRQPEPWLLLGLGRERLGELQGAEHDLRVALEIAPSAVAWKSLGALLGKRGDVAGAIDAFAACVAIGPPDAAVSANLGKLLYEDGRLGESAGAYATALQLEPSNAHYRRMARRTRFLRDLLERVPVDEAIATFASASEAELIELVEAASAALTGFGLREAALRLARRRVELWPQSAAARYLLASLLGEAPLARSPDDYLVESFDAFAETFEAHLVGVLGYDVPEKLGALVNEVVEQGHLYDALDAGCGTGLCGPWLRPLARRLTGVDLSPRMLDRARERGLYDALVCEELTAYLQRSTGAFDLVVAADVLIYFGDLGPLFEAAAGALRPGGLLVVSFEGDDGDGHTLRSSGRFAHALGYVERVASPAFTSVTSRSTTLRREGRQRVAGHLLVLRRA
jgi:predicted TPR repeat methyltransferase